MSDLDLSIIPTSLWDQYHNSFDINLENNLESLKESELTADNFNFYVSVSAVYSSKIEGEDIEMDSFIKHKRFGASFLPDYTKKIDDLYSAYEFAMYQSLEELNIMKCHELLTTNILHESARGQYRKSNMYVVTDEGQIEYVAVIPSKLESEMNKWIGDISTLLNAQLSFTQIFYFASMIHLVFLKIHPFEDGNGRMSRLLEKWFLAKFLGEKAWFIKSEKFYYDNKKSYYNSIRKLGLDSEELNFNEAMDFLKLMPKSIA
jgi:Fic family protein